MTAVYKRIDSYERTLPDGTYEQRTTTEESTSGIGELCAILMSLVIVLSAAAYFLGGGRDDCAGRLDAAGKQPQKCLRTHSGETNKTMYLVLVGKASGCGQLSGTQNCQT